MKKSKSGRESSPSSDEKDDSLIIKNLVARALAIKDAKHLNQLDDIEANIRKNYRRSVVQRAVNPSVISSTPCGPPAGMVLSQNISSISNESSEKDKIKIPSIRLSLEKSLVVENQGVVASNLLQVPSRLVDHSLREKITRSRIYSQAEENIEKEIAHCSKNDGNNTRTSRQSSHHSQRNLSKNSACRLPSVREGDSSDSSVFENDEEYKTKTKLNGNSSKLKRQAAVDSSYENQSNKDKKAKRLLSSNQPTIEYSKRAMVLPLTVHEDTISSTSSYNLRERSVPLKDHKFIKPRENLNKHTKHNRRKELRRSRSSSNDSLDEQNTNEAYSKHRRNGRFQTKPSKYLHTRTERYSSTDGSSYVDKSRKTSKNRHYSYSGRSKESRKTRATSRESRKSYRHRYKRQPSHKRHYSKSGHKKRYPSDTRSPYTSFSESDNENPRKNRRLSRVEKHEQEMKYRRRRRSCDSEKSLESRDASSEFKRPRRTGYEKTNNQTKRTEDKVANPEALSNIVGLLAAQLHKIQNVDVPTYSHRQSNFPPETCTRTQPETRSTYKATIEKPTFDWNAFLGNTDPQKDWLHKYNIANSSRSLDFQRSDEWSQTVGNMPIFKRQFLKQLARKPWTDMNPTTRRQFAELSECSVDEEGTDYLLHRSKNQSKRKISKNKRNLNEIINRLSVCTTKSSRRKKKLGLIQTNKKFRHDILDEILGYIPKAEKESSVKEKTIINKNIVKIKDQGTQSSPLEVHSKPLFSSKKKILPEILNRTNEGLPSNRETLHPSDNESDPEKNTSHHTVNNKTHNNVDIVIESEKSVAKTSPHLRKNKATPQKSPKKISTKFEKSTQNCLIGTQENNNIPAEEFVKNHTKNHESAKLESATKINTKETSKRLEESSHDCYNIDIEEKLQQFEESPIVEFNGRRNPRAQHLKEQSRKKLNFSSVESSSMKSKSPQPKSKENVSKNLEDESETAGKNRIESLEDEPLVTYGSNEPTSMKTLLNSEEVYEFESDSIDTKRNVSLKKKSSRREISTKNNSRLKNPVNVSLRSSVEFRGGENVENISMGRRKTKSNNKKEKEKADVSVAKEPKIKIIQNVTVRKKRSNFNNNINTDISYVEPHFGDAPSKSSPLSNPQLRHSREDKILGGNSSLHDNIHTEGVNQQNSPVSSRPLRSSRRLTHEEAFSTRNNTDEENNHQESRHIETPNLRRRTEEKKDANVHNEHMEQSNSHLTSKKSWLRDRDKQEDEDVDTDRDCSPELKSKRGRNKDKILSGNSKSHSQHMEKSNINMSTEKRSLRVRKNQEDEDIVTHREGRPTLTPKLKSKNGRDEDEIISAANVHTENKEHSNFYLSPKKTSFRERKKDEDIVSDARPVLTPKFQSKKGRNEDEILSEAASMEHSNLNLTPKKKSLRARKKQEDEHSDTETQHQEENFIISPKLGSKRGRNENEDILSEDTNKLTALNLTPKKIKKEQNKEVELYCMIENIHSENKEQEKSLLSPKLRSLREQKKETPPKDTSVDAQNKNQENVVTPKLKSKKAGKKKDQKPPREEVQTENMNQECSSNTSRAVRASTRVRKPPSRCYWKSTLTERDCEVYGNLFLPTAPSSDYMEKMKKANNKTKKGQKQKKDNESNKTKKTKDRKKDDELNKPATSNADDRNEHNIELDAHDMGYDTYQSAENANLSTSEEVWQSVFEKVEELNVGTRRSFHTSELFKNSIKHGLVRLDPLQIKKSTNSNYTVIYYVLQGLLSLTIGHKYFEKAPLTFEIPKGKSFIFHNKRDEPVFLCYIIDNIQR